MMVADCDPRLPDPQLSDHQDDQVDEYRALSSSAVVGVLLGLLAPLAVLDPWLLVVPVSGILCNALALWQIARNAPALLGRKAALAGLAFSIFFLAVVPTHRFVRSHMVRAEARQFAAAWFEMLADGQPHKANQLTIHPQYRQPLDERLWDFYGEGPRWRAKLEDYVAVPLVRTLLQLGKDAQVRYYKTSDQRHDAQLDKLAQIYAVTFDDAGGKKTFFVGVELKRHRLESGQANWQVASVSSDVRPAGL